MTKIRVLVNGAHGKMGQESVKAIQADTVLEYVGGANHGDNLAALISQTKPDVVLDFTVACVVFENTRTIIESGVRPVVGTSGLLPEQVKTLKALCAEKKLGGIIVPNFSIGAILMMKFAADAARYLTDVEIIELHHDGKQDAPSGTAIKTADMIANNRARVPTHHEERELLAGARGGVQNDIHIHSVRLPGLMAHQTVIFGGKSETLQIRHDSIHRDSFMPGVCLACKKVMGLDELVYGLETLL
jgi:4-hydroxy-tetrahydrodipicolinate reductase